MNTINRIANTSLVKELKDYIASYIEDYSEDMRIDELHQELFNNSCYVVGYYNCKEWLKKHNVCSFDAIEFVQDYEELHFGETNTKVNSEAITNMLIYIVGEEILNELEFSDTYLTEETKEYIINELS